MLQTDTSETVVEVSSVSNSDFKNSPIVLPELPKALKKAIEERTPIPQQSNDISTKQENTDDTNNELERSEIDESNVNFSQNRELWQRRANLDSAPASPLLKTHRLSEPFIPRQNHTPDLVMDLPLLGNLGQKEQLTKSMSILGGLYSDGSFEDDHEVAPTTDSCSEPDSPDMHTAAETFAKQNQCTLKKNKKNHIQESSEYVAITSPVPDRKYATLGCPSTTSTFKPQPKTKPMVLKKPTFTVPLRSVSIEMICKEPPDFPT